LLQHLDGRGEPAALHARLQRDSLKLKEISERLQKAVALSNGNRSTEIVRLSTQMEKLTGRVQAELRGA
jgi:hypothetical protein